MNSRSHVSKHTAQDLDKVLRVLQDTPTIDREYMAPLEEFQARVRRTNHALQHHGHTVGLVFSDEHYAGDVPYLGGNTNISIEQVAGSYRAKRFSRCGGPRGRLRRRATRGPCRRDGPQSRTPSVGRREISHPRRAPRRRHQRRRRQGRRPHRSADSTSGDPRRSGRIPRKTSTAAKAWSTHRNSTTA